MDKNPSKNDELKAIREQKEQPLLDAFQGAKMWFHEKYLLFETTVKIETDEWGHASHSVASLIRRLRSLDDGI